MFGFAGILRADDDNTPVKSEVKDVTVFISSAQITRTATTTLQVGTNKLVFENLSQYINASSIQVKGIGDFTILSVSSQLNYLKMQESSKEQIAFEDSLENLNNRLIYQQSLLVVLSQEQTMILSNQILGGSQTGLKVSELKEAADFFRTRLSEIKAKELAINSKIKTIQTDVAKYTNQLSLLNSKKNIPTGEILVTVSAKAKCTASFSLSYTVTNSGWVPSYDLRATDASSPIALTYKASVYQTTGEDWKNVKLTLSTGNPTQSGTKPTLYPWYLYIYNNTSDYRSYNDKSQAQMKAKDDGDYEKSTTTSGSYTEALTSAYYTTVSETQTNIEFEIALPYSILSDGKYNEVEIQNYTLPATYQYYCAPKIDNDAFLIAKVTGWEQYNLLSGNMNLYFEGTYVGKSYVNSKTTTDTLEISLGRDKSISVTRVKQKDLSSKSLIGANRKVVTSWEISVRNKKKQAVSILIEDQIPVTTDKTIEIDKLEYTGATLNETTGILKWNLTINPAETKKLKFSYTVKYPKDNTLYLE